MKILTVVGARPNFMKAAPIIAAIRKRNKATKCGEVESGNEEGPSAIQHILVHTGQHYDPLMSDAFFADLNLPVPDIQLCVGSESHVRQTAEISKRFEPVLLQERPDAVVVLGDVNSTLACAMVAAKTTFDSAGTRPLLAHVEAGLRSFDRSMPEEINRVLTDHLSDVLFVTEESAIQNLQNEGIPASAIRFVGNTMIDSLLAFSERAEGSTILQRLRLAAHLGGSGKNAGDAITRYVLLTLHRPSNVDNHKTFLNIMEGLAGLARRYRVIFPVHPRTKTRIKEFGLGTHIGTTRSEASCAPGDDMSQCGITLTEPLGYLDFVCLMKHASLVVTDSGGIQEETTCLGIPCVTVRENTERPVTIHSGTNVIAGTTKEGISVAVQRQLGRTAVHSLPPYWDGRAGARIVDVLIGACEARMCSKPDVLMERSA